MHVYMAKVDSALFMISSILHLVRKGKASEMPEVPVGDAFDATLKADAVADNLEMFEAENENDVAKVAVENFEVHTEDTVDKATGEKSEALGDEKNADDAPTPAVEQDVNAYGIKVTWAVCPQLRHRPVSECRRRCEWDVIARRAVDPSYNLVRPLVQPVDKDSKEYKQRIKKASSNFFASAGAKFNTLCCGLAAIDCKCGFSSGLNSDRYWNLTKASQSRGDDKK